jgi:Ca2+-binding RTX toxin-like protein
MPNVRIGTNADDTLVGTILDDIILSLGGNDHADGGAGNDTVLAGAGRDTVVGGDGADSLSGEDGNDALFGGAGEDTLLGRAGNDLLVWNSGDGSDAVTGGSGLDTAIVNGARTAVDSFTVTGGGMDVLLSLAGPGIALNLFQIEALEIYGQDGDDRLVVGDVSGTSLQQIYFEGGLGDDTLDAIDATRALVADGGDGSDMLTSGQGSDTLRGGAGADVLTGRQGDDLLDGGSGADRFLWSFGDGGDRLIGGADIDTLAIAGTTADDSLILQLEGNALNIGSADAASGSLDVAGVEVIEISGEDGADLLRIGDLSASAPTKVAFDGGRGADILDASETTHAVEAGGSADRDTLIGGAGSDGLTGGGDDDVLIGGASADTLVGETGDDLLDGESGQDSLSGGLGDDTLNAGDAMDVLSGGAGEDLIWGAGGADVFRYTLAELNNGAAEGDLIVDYAATEGDEVDLPNAISSVASAYVLNDKLIVVLDGDGDTLEFVGVQSVLDLVFV